jgi:16S rRNA (adenine1518-N6/adenine1519-N6)-dimethyltransferase
VVSDGLLGAADIRRIAADLDLRPTKTLGQNFVVDANTVRRTTRAAELRADDVVLEVGPGLGSLTLALLGVSRRVVAVEVDPRLADRLPVTVAERVPESAERLAVLTADALRVDRATVMAAAGEAPTALVANLPYNVAVPVLLHLLAELPGLRRVLVLVQAEVAARLCAAPGSRVYGAPTVKLAWWGTARPAGAVPRSVFWPVPNVDSALVAVDVHRGEPAPVDACGVGAERDEADADPALRRDVFRLIDAAFAQRRKTLRSALAGWAGSPAAAEQALRSAGVDPAARAETLDVEAFTRLARAVVVAP